MAQEFQDLPFNWGAFGKYLPYTGEGGSDRVPQDGRFSGPVKSFKCYMSKADPSKGKISRPMVKLIMQIADEDAANTPPELRCKGLQVIEDACAGTADVNGEDMGRQFLDACLSAGVVTLEQVHAWAQAAQQGQGSQLPTVAALAARIVGPTAYFELQSERDLQGNETSGVKRWYTEPDRAAQHAQAVSTGSHRRPRRAIASNPQSAAAAAGFNLGGGGLPGQVQQGPGAPALGPPGAGGPPGLGFVPPGPQQGQPQQGWGPPQQGWGPPQPGYAPPAGPPPAAPGWGPPQPAAPGYAAPGQQAPFPGQAYGQPPGAPPPPANGLGQQPQMGQLPGQNAFPGQAPAGPRL